MPLPTIDSIVISKPIVLAKSLIIKKPNPFFWIEKLSFNKSASICFFDNPFPVSVIDKVKISFFCYDASQIILLSKVLSNAFIALFVKF